MFYAIICVLVLANGLVASEVTKQPDFCGETNILLRKDVEQFNFLWFAEQTEEQTCTYNVTGWEGTLLRLSIIGMYLNDTKGCTKNYIKVADNQSVLETSKLVTCGAGSFDVTTSSYKMGIRVHVEDFNNSFILGNIEWTIDEAKSNPPTCGESLRIIKSRSDSLTIPVKGGSFDQPTVCSYLISSFNHQPLELQLQTFSLDGGKNCDESYLDVWVDTGRYRLCNDMPPKRTIVSGSGEMRVVLKTIKNPQNTKIAGTIFNGPINLQNATTPVLPYSLNGANRIYVYTALLLCTLLHWW